LSSNNPVAISNSSRWVFTFIIHYSLYNRVHPIISA